MKLTGELSMLVASWGDPVSYMLRVGDVSVPVSRWLGRRLRLHFLEEIHCVRCGRSTRKTYSDGYCYPCFQTAPECSPCVIKPELCRAGGGAGPRGTCMDRDPAWAEKNHNAPQVAYLAVSSGLKIGVTRPDRIPIRWINQGAVRAIPFAIAPNRRAIGVIECAGAEHVADRTDWRKMLRNQFSDVDLLAEKRRLADILKLSATELHEINEITNITYPVLEYPEKVRSVTLDKAGELDGILVGIKGQYLMFEGGMVFNVRRHQGYRVELDAIDSSEAS